MTAPAPAPAVLAVTPNPALDVTLAVDELIPHATLRLGRAVRRLGGKGVNVARTAAQFGHPALALGPLNPRELARLAAEAAADPGHATALGPAVAGAFTDTDAPLRETFAIHDRAADAVTIINEAGRPHPEGVLDRLVEDLAAAARARPGSTVTVSGSLPPGADATLLTRLAAAARAAGARLILDTSGPALPEACAAGPDVVKPNGEELARATGIADPVAGARELIARGAREVLVSLGGEGLLSVTADRVLRARLPEPLPGNPTGAGDACVAALATADLDGLGERDRLIRAVAWSAGTVLSPVAGTVDPAHADLAGRVLVDEPA